jgi:hypothetical protein
VGRASDKAVAHQRKDDIAQREVDDTSVQSMEPCLVKRRNRAIGFRAARISRREVIYFSCAHHFSLDLNLRKGVWQKILTESIKYHCHLSRLSLSYTIPDHASYSELFMTTDVKYNTVEALAS